MAYYLHSLAVTKDDYGAFVESSIVVPTLDLLRLAARVPRKPGNMKALDLTVRFANMASDYGRLTTVRYEVLAGNMDVFVADPDVLAKVPEIQRQWPALSTQGLSPVVKREYVWKQLTQIHHGIGADFLQGEGPFRLALFNSTPDSGILGLARSLDMPLLALANQGSRPLLKRYAPDLLKLLETELTSEEAREAVVTIEWLLAKAKLSNPLAWAGPAGSARVGVTELEQFAKGKKAVRGMYRLRSDLADRVLLPVILREGPALDFPPALCGTLRRLLLTVRPDTQKQAVGEVSGFNFEVLLARLFDVLGATADLAGHYMTRMELLRTPPEEVDLLAWSDRCVYLIEAKYEMEPPGAWDVSAVANRKDWMKEETTKLLAKAPAWKDELEKIKPRARLHGTTVDLPANLLKTRTLRCLLISGRLEPRADGYQVVRSLVPSKALEVMGRLLPMGCFCPTWDGSSLP